MTAERAQPLQDGYDDNAPRSARQLVLDRTFGSFFWGKLLASSGVWIQGVAAAVVVYAGTGSATAVSMVSVAQATPQLLLGPWSGALADRNAPMPQIVAGRVLCVGGSGALAAFFAFADPGPSLLVIVVALCSFVVGTGFVIGGPAMQTVIPDMVRSDELHTAMTLNTAPMTTARILGPALGAFMLAWSGPAATFGLSAATHLVFAALLVFVARLPPRPEPDGDTRASMWTGLTYLRRRPDLSVFLAATALIGIGTEPTLTLAPALSESMTGDLHWTGPLTLSFGIGSLVGLVFTPWIGRRWPVAASAWTGLGVMTLAIGSVVVELGTVWTFACFGLAGVGFSWGMAGFSSMLQSETDPRFRGRVMAWWLIAFLGSRPISSAATGLVTDQVSVRAAFGVTALGLAVVTACLGLALWLQSRCVRFHSTNIDSVE